MRRLYILLASVMIAATFIAVASSTGASAAGEKFAALAVTPSLAATPIDGTGFYLQQAKRNAMDSCQTWAAGFPKYYRDDCQGAVWVRNGWAAVAYETTLEGPPYYPQWGWGWGDTKDEAIKWAHKYCEQAAHEPCQTGNYVKSPAWDRTQAATGGGW